MLILATGWTILLSIAIVSVSVLLIGLVLLQKNRGSGLSGAFGGVGGHSAFGTKTGDFLTWLTVGLTVLFLLLNVVGNYAFEPDDISARSTPNQAEVEETPDVPEENTTAPPATTTPETKPGTEATGTGTGPTPSTPTPGSSAPPATGPAGGGSPSPNP
jgi:preprotein translocase subunit SecG